MLSADLLGEPAMTSPVRNRSGTHVHALSSVRPGAQLISIHRRGIEACKCIFCNQSRGGVLSRTSWLYNNHENHWHMPEDPHDSSNFYMQSKNTKGGSSVLFSLRSLVSSLRLCLTTTIERHFSAGTDSRCTKWTFPGREACIPFQQTSAGWIINAFFPLQPFVPDSGC